MNNYVVSKIFRYVPKNRIIANTFKVRKSEAKQLNANSESFNSFVVFGANSHHNVDQKFGGNTSQQFPVMIDGDHQMNMQTHQHPHQQSQQKW